MKKILVGLVAGLLMMSGCGQIDAKKVDQQPAVTTTLYAQWVAPVKLPMLGWFTKTDQFEEYTEYSFARSSGIAGYYKVGTTMYHNQPSEIIMVVSQSDGLGPSYGEYYFFLKNSSTTIFIPNESSRISENPSGAYDNLGLYATSTISNALNVVFDNLHFSTTITGQQAGQKLTLENVFPDVEKLVVAKKIFTDTENEPVGLGDNGTFYVKHGPLVGMYSLHPAFFTERVPAITWSDGTVNTGEYVYQAIGGCGSSNYANVIAVDQVNPKTDLTVVGKNNSGESIFALKNTNHELLKGVFDYTYIPGTPKPTYANFLKQHPLVFWVDPFGRLIALRNSKFLPQAECGKPVIYLYPPQTTTTTVILQPQGGFTYSMPEYVVNWYVKAEPNGHLTDIHTGKEYPYLFWEGRGGFYEQPKKGWSVKQKDLKTFLPAKLKQLGLNKDETADFLEFWLPRMQAKPYYFVTFMGNKTMDTLAPLTVSPKPDTVIRILMDFTPLDAPIKVSGYTIRTPKRTGFSVVEWGGVLR